MMELVSIVAGAACGVMGGTVVALLLLIWQANAEAMRAIRRERGKLPSVHIVERRMLEDGKR